MIQRGSTANSRLIRASLRVFFAVALLALATAESCVIRSYDDISGCLSSTDILMQGPFTVPANKVVNMGSLNNGTRVTVSGTVSWANGTRSTYLFTLGGSGIVFDGTNGTFDGQGPQYWDGLGTNGGVRKPNFIKIQTKGGSYIKGLTVKNAPAHIVRVAASDTVFDGLIIDNSDGDQIVNGKTLGHNSDAFDVSATNVTIQNTKVHNQDDCVALQGDNIRFYNNYCYGGHGISIGSVSTGETVSNIHVKDCTLVSNTNGLRIKVNSGATGGYVRNVLWENIMMKQITTYGIVIEQDYLNGGATGHPTGGIPISNITALRVFGTVTAEAKNSVYILCANCTDFHFQDVAIRGMPGNCSGIVPLPKGC
ncbi:glycoside hydrolase family 28 protein [Gonapodya prolifera JEL478]|uniref:endo-polygalacturonase n=1 Tax=Gonapodya prolifera (strain JEL478) TaxID=1344416 RepID=A0A139AUS8_GONPJ|nr:glycoside hydrolase family 28 protein [Gonapodya prolifera JEL478]|eukprot:KXS20490.1 glycoside hydrolase family 28 protein [Gonapodya prolifera JEL478]